jgi:hypothetical protein
MAYLMGSLGPLLACSLRISNRKLRAATTWRPIHPSVREGWPAMIRQMREHPRGVPQRAWRHQDDDMNLARIHRLGCVRSVSTEGLPL